MSCFCVLLSTTGMQSCQLDACCVAFNGLRSSRFSLDASVLPSLPPSLHPSLPSSILPSLRPSSLLPSIRHSRICGGRGVTERARVSRRDAEWTARISRQRRRQRRETPGDGTPDGPGSIADRSAAAERGWGGGRGPRPGSGARRIPLWRSIEQTSPRTKRGAIYNYYCRET